MRFVLLLLVGSIALLGGSGGGMLRPVCAQQQQADDAETATNVIDHRSATESTLRSIADDATTIASVDAVSSTAQDMNRAMFTYASVNDTKARPTNVVDQPPTSPASDLKDSISQTTTTPKPTSFQTPPDASNIFRAAKRVLTPSSSSSSAAATANGTLMRNGFGDFEVYKRLFDHSVWQADEVTRDVEQACERDVRLFLADLHEEVQWAMHGEFIASIAFYF